MVGSHFKTPENANNSYWSPESVPSVKAQSWAANYRDGMCGIREMDEGFDVNDPALDGRCFFVVIIGARRRRELGGVSRASILKLDNTW